MAEQGDGPARAIVVGIDGSDASIEALRWACGLAVATGGTVEAVTSWQWPMSLGTAIPFPSEYDPGGDAQRMVDDIVGPMGGAFPTVPVRARAVEGHPAEVLVAASAHGDLLVVGSRGHGEVAGMLLGSVSQHCVTHAHSSVLVYRRRTT
ncbi:MAG: universal stress protein [Acidimicrobiales bacterium]